MIHPSYVDLMKVVNKGVEEGETPVINSRYSIVMATAKRARQIVDGDEILINAEKGEKPLSIAVEELNQGKIRILAEDEPEEDFEEEELFLSNDDMLALGEEDAFDEADEDAAEDAENDGYAETDEQIRGSAQDAELLSEEEAVEGAADEEEDGDLEETVLTEEELAEAEEE